MEFAPVQTNEQELLETGRHYSFPRIIDEAVFDHIFQLASQICNSPYVLSGIVDVHGSYCQLQDGVPHIKEVFDFAADEIFVPDMSKDERFANSPLVTGNSHFVSYACFPTAYGEANTSGSLCIWSTRQISLDKGQMLALQSLAGVFAINYEQAKTSAWQLHKIEELKIANTDLDSFANIAAHDLKSPLNAIISLTHLIKSNYGDKLDEEGNEYIGFLGQAANNLTQLVSGILSYSRSTQVLDEKKELITFTDLIEELTGLLEIPANASIVYAKSDLQILSSPPALKQILLNLLDNAIRHNDKDQVKIEITFEEEKSSYTITVKDNGPGISGHGHDKAFDLFKTLQKKIKEKQDTTIGLAIVKKLVDKLKGAIHMQTDETTGTTFIITLPK